VTADLGELLDSFQRSAARLETLDRYTIPREEAWLEAFRRDGSIPDLTPATYPWLKLIADTTSAGRTVQRVHVVGWPLPEYIRWELGMYRLTQAAGEDIRIADRIRYPELGNLGPDFWLFDQTTVAVMRYDPEGRFLGAELATDAAPYRAQWELALGRSVSLDAYLASIDGSKKR
jgi:hypothetical protein